MRMKSILSCVLLVSALFSLQLPGHAQSFPDNGFTYFDRYYIKMVGVGNFGAYTSTIGLDGSMVLQPRERAWRFENPVNVNGTLTLAGTGGTVSFRDVSNPNGQYLDFAAIDGSLALYDFRTSTYRMVSTPEGNFGIGTNDRKVSALLEVGKDDATNTRNKMIVHGGAKFNNDADNKHLTQVTVNTNTSITGAALTVGGPAYIGSWNDTEEQVKAEYLQKYHLWVKNGVVSEDFAVAKVNTWRDEVFKEGYQLPALHDVENFVSEHKHLPGIPSEAEVKENGYTVNQITVAFLEKIEHLTLYAIEQDKKIKSLEAQIEQYNHLQQEIEALKAALKK